MGRITKTELNQQTARVLARVAEGERLTVTERGRAIAEIVPVRDSRWEQLVRAGRVQLPSAVGPLSVPPARGARSAAEILDEIRGD